MVQRVCPTCEGRNPPGEFFCAGCGANISGVEPTEEGTTVDAALAAPAVEGIVPPFSRPAGVRCPSCGLDQAPASYCIRCDAALPVMASWFLVWPWDEETVLVGSLAIGRDSSPEWLRDRYQREAFANLSRSHALLEVYSDQAQVTDLGSSNGTFLNGKGLAPRVATSVRSGDELRFASRLTITVRQKSQA